MIKLSVKRNVSKLGKELANRDETAKTIQNMREWTHRSCNAASDDNIPLVFGNGFETSVELPANPNGYADDHGRNGNTGQEGDADRCTD